MKIYSKDLFPQLKLYPSYWERREYVESRMSELIANGEFFLTDICNQPDNRSTNLAAEVICGTMIQDKRYTDAHVPQDIEDHKIFLRPIYGDEIVYEAGWKQVGMLRNNMPILRKVNKTYKVNKYGYVSIPLKDGWIALNRYGKNVRPAKSERLRSSLWRYEEITKEQAEEMKLKYEEAKAEEEQAKTKNKKVA